MEQQKVLYPLTNAQEGIWEMEQFYKGTSIANIGGALFLNEKIDFDIWEQCINKIIEQNDSLRIRIVKTNNGPKQFIETYKYQKPEHVDFTGKSRIEQDTWLTERLQIPFDVYGERLYAFISIKAWDGWNGVYLKFHHILGDGWTIGLLSTQIMEEYARRQGKANGEDTIKYSYLDFIQSEQEYINSAKYEKDRQYWLEKFNNKPTFVSIKPKNGFHYTSEAKRLTYTIEAKEAGIIRDYCRVFSTSPAILFEAVLGIFLKRLNAENRITLGVPVLNRRGIKELSTVGMYVSAIPIQIVLDDNVSFSELCRQIGKEHFQCFRHQRYPYNRILAEVRELHGIHHDLYDVSVSYQNAKINKAKHSFDFKTVWYFNGHQTESFCLHIDDRDDAGIFVLHVDYLREFFHEAEIEDIYKRIMLILMQAIIDGSRKISDLELVDERERYKLLYVFNHPKADYPKDKLIHQLFEEQVVKTPDNIALVFGERALTYRELNCRANGIAAVLRRKGVGPDAIIGIMSERTPEMVIGILAILKAGGAYLPIDPEYPEERIGFMLEDSRAEVLLTQRHLKGRVAYRGEVIALSSEELVFCSRKDREDLTRGNLENVSTPENLAYVIYTSGSTGRPKGVLVEHKNVLAYVNAFQKEFNVTEEDAVLQQASSSFDAFVEETYPVLLKGGRLVLASREEVRDVKLLEGVVNRNSISLISCSPFVINHLNTLSGLKSVHTFISGGDVLKGEYIDNLLRRGAQVYNTYGPTEATVCASYYKCLPDDRNRALVPIGKPIANYRIYILDTDSLMPVNIPGELCIAGDGVSRGYLNRPELTAEKFVENPFVQGERIYRTGDLARWLPDGNIEFLGRIDNQVKIRGFRVELGEVEVRLLKLDGVKEAVVTVREDNTGGKYLCAHLVGDSEGAVSELRKCLAKELPDYMIPSWFLQLDKLPLTPNGKIDRQALPEPEGNINPGAEYIPPSTDTEQRLARLWQEILGVEKIGVNDNFFELGGHSLKAAILTSKIQKEFKVELPLREIFKASTINEVAISIDKASESMNKDIASVEKRDYYPASPAQRGLYFLNCMDRNSTSYNMPSAMKIEGSLDLVKLEKAFKRLVQRHEALRTSFQVIGADVVQKIEDHLEFTIDVEELEEASLPTAMNGFVKPFNLSKAALLRVKLLKIVCDEQGEYDPPTMYFLLLFDMHHIISDGTSMTVLVKDFISFYKGEELPELRLHYKDFAVWQNKELASEKVRKQKAYWLRAFEGNVPVLELPTDYPRPAIQNSEGDVIGFNVNQELTAGLQKLAAENGTTLYMMLLAAYNVLLYKYTGQEDMVVGTPTAGRWHPDLDGIIGMFVNTLAMRNYPQGKKRFTEFLREVRESALLAYENQDVQYKELVEELSIKIDLSRNPLFDTMLVLQNMDSFKLEIEGLRFTSYGWGIRAAKFDISLTAEEFENEIHFDLEYCTQLFKKDTMQRFIKHFTNILKAVVENPELKLSSLDMLAEEERKQILFEFNQPKAYYPKDKLIHQLFEEQVVKTPDNIAVVFGDGTLTYRGLNSKANGVAQVLRGKGVGPDRIVGIMTECSVEMIVGILAVLKAGGAYLPIDPEYPEERIGYMLEDSKAEVLLTQGPLKGRIAYQGEVIALSSEELVFGGCKDREDLTQRNLENVSSPEDLAYVIYTSGSTGRPKGVLVEHRNLLAYVNAFQKEFNVTEEDVVLQQASSSFDAFVEETYPVLLKGGRLVLASREEVRDVNLLEGVINRNSISLISCSPFVLNHLNTLPGLKSVHTFISGGDVLKGEYIDNLLLGGAQVYNTYGPTEATVCASYFKCLPDDRGLVPIGKSIANYRIYILDTDNLVPVNIPGELCIAGDGVSRGYLNRPELTAEKFVENLFVLGERIYRTGDLARWLPDGNIEFLGRIDDQVKIRGFRVELGEVEARLLKLGEVKEAVVMAREDNTGSKYLCAYLSGDREIVVSELRKCLAKELPDYMIPSRFLQLENLPLTPNGKIDRQALPEPEGNINTEAEYIPPSSDTEIRLARLWQEVLGVDRIGVNDNFFELGGHSLKATVLATKVRKEFGINIPLVKVFSEGTIAMLADYIDTVKPAVKPDFIPDVEPAVRHIPDQKLVLLKAVEGARENLFLIHDGSCTVEGYVEFSHRLESDANVWGIKAAEADDDDVIMKGITIADLAGDYLKTIKTIQQEGPYSIAGWSSGGVIVFEIALQLETAGETIRFVSLIDSSPPSYEDSGRVLKGQEEMWDELEAYLEGGEKADGRTLNRIPYAIIKLISDYRTLNTKELNNRLKLIKTVLNAESRYQPTAKLQAELVYIGASESKDIDNNKWSGYCETPVRYVEVKGDHFSIFKSPDVIGLTKAFAQNFPKIPELK